MDSKMKTILPWGAEAIVVVRRLGQCGMCKFSSPKRGRLSPGALGRLTDQDHDCYLLVNISATVSTLWRPWSRMELTGMDIFHFPPWVPGRKRARANREAMSKVLAQRPFLVHWDLVNDRSRDEGLMH